MFIDLCILAPVFICESLRILDTLWIELVILMGIMDSNSSTIEKYSSLVNILSFYSLNESTDRDQAVLLRVWIGSQKQKGS